MGVAAALANCGGPPILVCVPPSSVSIAWVFIDEPVYLRTIRQPGTDYLNSSVNHVVLRYSSNLRKIFYTRRISSFLFDRTAVSSVHLSLAFDDWTTCQ